MHEDINTLTDKLIEKLRAIGPERVTTRAQLAKLREEVEEVAELIETDASRADILEELADVVIVCTVATRLLGFTAEQLVDEVEFKSYRNARRVWAASGKTAQHVEEASRASCNCDVGRGYRPSDPGVFEAATAGCPIHGADAGGRL